MHRLSAPRGSYALPQNARIPKHKKLTPNQLHLSAASSMESGKPAKLHMQLGAYVAWDKTTGTEITWALKMIESILENLRME